MGTQATKFALDQKMSDSRSKANCGPCAKSTPHPILRMQRAAGNYSVGGLLERSQEPSLGPPIRIGSPDAPEEREADRIADLLTAPEEPAMPVCAACAAGGEPCEACGGGDGGGVLRRQVAGGASAAASGGEMVAPASVHRVLSEPGEPLPSRARSGYERFFGVDLSDVRVHTDDQANQAAEAIHAHAFTYGNSIFFAHGQFDPIGTAGRELLAHELTHTLQRSGADDHIRRDGPTPAPAPAPAIPPAGLATPIGPPVPPKGYTSELFGVTLSENRDQVKAAMRDEVVRKGIRGPDTYLAQVEGYGSNATIEASRKFQKDAKSPGGVSGGVPETDEEIASREQVRDVLLPVLRGAVLEVNKESQDFLVNFENVLRDNAIATLDANKLRAEAEKKRYGIETHTQVVNMRRGGAATITTYSMMDGTSPAVDGLKASASVLLARRQKITEQEKRVEQEASQVDSVFETPEWEKQHKTLLEMQESYSQLLEYVSIRHPVLDRLGDLKRDPDGLAQVAQGKGPLAVGTAVGAQLDETLTQIESSRAAVKNGGANLWRMKELVGLAVAQTGTESLPFNQRLFEDRFDAEQKHVIDDVIESVLVLLLNLAAVALAAPTGGASLVPAFGMNAALAAIHTQDYLRERALSGSSMVRAQSLSQEEPSLLWLAIEIIGVGLEAGPALAAFRRLVPLVRSALQGVARTGKVAVETVEAINAVGRDAGKAELGVQVLSRVGTSGEASLVKAGIATEAELGAISKVATAVEKDAGAIVGVIRSAVGGEIKLSKSGYLFTCRSPCMWLRERYLDIFNRDADAMKSLLDIEKHASEAARARAAAEETAKGLEKAVAEKLLDKANKEVSQVQEAASELEAALHKKYPELSGRLIGSPAVVPHAEPGMGGRMRAVTNAGDLDVLGMSRPEIARPPASVTDAALSAEQRALRQRDWEAYCGYYEDRLRQLEREVGAGTVTSESPIDWESYQRFLGSESPTQRGRGFQSRVTGSMEDPSLAASFLTEGDIALSRIPRPTSKAGEIVRPDQFMVDMDQLQMMKEGRLASTALNVTASSNKSRDFASLIREGTQAELRAVEEIMAAPKKTREHYVAPELRAVEEIIKADVRELFTKYSGRLYVRRRGDLFGREVRVRELVLVYESALMPTSTIDREAVRAIASRLGSTRAAQGGFTFWIAFQ
jgi:hypothetical protein